MSPWVAVAVCPTVGLTGLRSTASLLARQVVDRDDDVPHDVLRHQELPDRIIADDAGE